jgi:DNA polymerase-2
MSSLHFYHALKDGRLIPWKATAAEKFKDAWSLLAADKGGFIFEPEVGLHDDVGEIDFSSLYPTIMAEKNISAETISCDCCPNSPSRVPELDYNICRTRGIVPKALDVLLEKRRNYKQLVNQIQDSKLRRLYDERQSALKWILVCCFGYLSFRNAKFGRIDAHMAVCAYARHTLLEACRIAEAQGFKVIHGIVDSLWLKKSPASRGDYLNLCDEISTKTGFRITLEGIYRWIAFLPSRIRSKIPVLNRYFGVFDDSSIKVRGIEARRSDTPQFIKRCQLEMLRTLAKGEDLDSATELIPDALSVLLEFARRLRSRDVPIDELTVSRRLTRDPWEYVTEGVGSMAAQQLIDEGTLLRAGQSVDYVITDYKSGLADRKVKAYRLITPQTSYDVEKYLEMLSDAAWSILQPFGYSRANLRRLLATGSWQTRLAM